MSASRITIKDTKFQLHRQPIDLIAINTAIMLSHFHKAIGIQHRAIKPSQKSVTLEIFNRISSAIYIFKIS